MQVEVSTSFETAGSERRPLELPQTAAEERRTSRVPVTAMAASSRLLHLHEEGLELRGPRVRVDGPGGERVRERPDVPRIAREAPMDREADLPDPLSVHRPGFEAFGDHRLSGDRAARARDLHLRSVRDPLLLRHLLGDL